LIVRILTEGQYHFPGAHVDELNDLDNHLVAVVEEDNQTEFQRLLKEMLDLVREKGTPLPLEELVESDLVLPEPDLTLQEAGALFTGEGLLPG
jgi:hypothetical protein